MVLDKGKVSRIITLLKGCPAGMSISEISQRLGMNRNLVAKYLDLLLVSGKVEVQLVGTAKIFFYSRRISLDTVLGISSDPVVVLDENANIIRTNDRFLGLFGLEREFVISRSFSDLPVPFLRGLGETIMLAGGRSGEGGEIEQRIEAGGKEQFFRIKLTPSVFEDGSRGTTILFKDITDRISFERELSRNEARYRGIAEDQTELICRTRTDGTVTFANEAFCRYFGLDQETIAGTIIAGLIHPGDWPLFLDSIQSLHTINPYTPPEFRVRHPDGREHWHRWTMRAFRQGGTGAGEYQFVGRDVTEERKARKSVEFFAALVESSEDAIVGLDSEGTIICWNRGAERTLGYSAREIVSAPFSRLLPDARTGWLQDLAASAAGSRTLSYPLLTKDGRTVSLPITVSPLMSDTGSYLGFSLVSRDVPAMRNAGVELIKREEAIAHAPDGIAFTDAAGRITRVNPPFLRMFGYAVPEEIIGEKILQHALPDTGDTSLIGRVVRELRERGEWTGEVRPRRKDGVRFHANLSVRCIRDPDGKPSSMTATFTDISPVKEAEFACEVREHALGLADPGILILDSAGNVAFANSSFLEDSGFGPEEVLALPARRLFVPAGDSDRPVTGILSYTGTHTLRQKDGPGLLCDLTLRHVPGKDGHPPADVISVRPCHVRAAPEAFVPYEGVPVHRDSGVRPSWVERDSILRDTAAGGVPCESAPSRPVPAPGKPGTPGPGDTMAGVPMKEKELVPGREPEPEGPGKFSPWPADREIIPGMGPGLPGRGTLPVPEGSYAVLMSLPDPVLILDRGYKVKRANRAALMLLGWRQSDLEGRHIVHFTAAEQRRHLLHSLRAASGGASRPLRFQLVGSTGRAFWEGSISPVRGNDNELFGYILLGRVTGGTADVNRVEKKRKTSPG